MFSDILSVSPPVCKAQCTRAQAAFKYLSTSHCTAPGFPLMVQTWKMDCFGQSEQPSCWQRWKIQSPGKMGNQIAAHWSFLRVIRQWCWYIVATVYRAHWTSCQGVKASEKRALTITLLPDAPTLLPIWRTHTFRLSEHKNKYNHPS